MSTSVQNPMVLLEGIREGLKRLAEGCPVDAAEALEAACEGTRTDFFGPVGEQALRAFRELAALHPPEARGVAECQALLGAHEMLVRLGGDMSAVGEGDTPAELGAQIARFLRAGDDFGPKTTGGAASEEPRRD